MAYTCKPSGRGVGVGVGVVVVPLLWPYASTGGPLH